MQKDDTAMMRGKEGFQKEVKSHTEGQIKLS